MHAYLMFGFAALGVVAFLVSVAMTVAAYPSLPARVPYSYDAVGAPRAFGPRPAAFLLVGAQAFVIAVGAFAVTHARPGPENEPWIAAMALSTAIVVMAFLQRQSLAVAAGRRASIGNAMLLGGIVVGLAMLAPVAASHLR